MSKHVFAIAVGVLGVVTVQLCVFGAVYIALPNWSERGQFGDVFGAANALFSGLAFAGLIYTVWLQREELALQRAELAMTRGELQRAAQAQEASEAALRAQVAVADRSARLDAATALLGHYRSELKKKEAIIEPGNLERRRERLELERKDAALRAILDSMYAEITGEQDESK